MTRFSRDELAAAAEIVATHRDSLTVGERESLAALLVKRGCRCEPRILVDRTRRSIAAAHSAGCPLCPPGDEAIVDAGVVEL